MPDKKRNMSVIEKVLKEEKEKANKSVFPEGLTLDKMMELMEGTTPSPPPVVDTNATATSVSQPNLKKTDQLLPQNQPVQASPIAELAVKDQMENIEKAGKQDVLDLEGKFTDKNLEEALLQTSIYQDKVDKLFMEQNKGNLFLTLLGTGAQILGLATGNPLLAGGGTAVSRGAERNMAKWREPYNKALNEYAKGKLGLPGQAALDYEKMAYDAALGMDPDSKTLEDDIRGAYQAHGLFPSEEKIKSIADVVRAQKISPREAAGKIELSAAEKKIAAKEETARDRIERVFVDFEKKRPYGKPMVPAREATGAEKAFDILTLRVPPYYEPSKKAGFGREYLDELYELLSEKKGLEAEEGVKLTEALEIVGGTSEALVSFLVRQGYEEPKAREIINNYLKMRGRKLP